MAKNGSLDLGQLQANLEQRTKDLKAANTKLKQALEQQIKAETEYNVANKSMTAGMDQLKAATKVV